MLLCSGFVMDSSEPLSLATLARSEETPSEAAATKVRGLLESTAERASEESASLLQQVRLLLAECIAVGVSQFCAPPLPSNALCSAWHGSSDLRCWNRSVEASCESDSAMTRILGAVCHDPTISSSCMASKLTPQRIFLAVKLSRPSFLFSKKHVFLVCDSIWP